MKINQKNSLVPKKGYSTVGHLQTINQLIEKYNEFSPSVCVGYIDYENAFDSIERGAISKSLRTIGKNETYSTVLEYIFTGATARVHMNEQIPNTERC